MHKFFPILFNPEDGGGEAPAPASTEHDGTLAGAASLITPDMLGDDVEQLGDASQAPAQTGRNEKGQFTKAEQETSEEPTQAEDEADQEQEAAAPSEDAPEDDDDWVEIPPENEGDEPTRYKLTELVEAKGQVETLRGELEAAKKEQPLPSQYEIAAQEMIAQREQYAQALQQWAAYNPVGNGPDKEMLNPASSQYDPEGYYNALQAYELRQQQHEAAKQEYESMTKANQEEQAKLHRNAMLKARDEIKQFWPELATPQEAKRVREELGEHYGITDEILATMTNPIAWKVFKDAIAHRRGAPKQQQAVKAVRAKPKLVSAAARQQVKTNAQQKTAKARAKLAKSGSLDDAADALKGLI